MQVKEIMTRGVECTTPNATLQEAARKMRDLDVGPLPVCDNDKLVGMLTDRDIALRAVAEGQDPRTTRVRDAMTPNVVWCFEDQDAGEAADLMQENQVRRLLVLNRNKRLVGILSLDDLAVRTGDESVTGHTLENMAWPAVP